MFNQNFSANGLLKIINEHIKQLERLKESISTQTKQSIRIQDILSQLSECQRGQQNTLKGIHFLVTENMKLKEELTLALAQKFEKQDKDNSICETIMQYEKTIQSTLHSLQNLFSSLLPNNSSNNSLYNQMKKIEEQTNKIKQELMFNRGPRQHREAQKDIQNGIYGIWGNTSSIRNLLQDIQNKLTFIQMEIKSLVKTFMSFQNDIKYINVKRLRQFQKQISKVLKELGQEC